MDRSTRPDAPTSTGRYSSPTSWGLNLDSQFAMAREYISAAEWSTYADLTRKTLTARPMYLGRLSVGGQGWGK